MTCYASKVWRENSQLNLDTKNAKKESDKDRVKVYADLRKAKNQAAITVETSTADPISDFEFSKGEFVKIFADSTSGVHPRENSACVGNVVRTDYSVEQGFNIVTITGVFRS